MHFTAMTLLQLNRLEHKQLLMFLNNILFSEVQECSGNIGEQLGGSKAQGRRATLLDLGFLGDIYGLGPHSSCIFLRSWMLLDSGPGQQTVSDSRGPQTWL